MDIKLSAKAFAQFLVGGPHKREQIVRNIRKSESKEAKAISHYYSPAVAVIRKYHAKGNDRTFLKEQLQKLMMGVEAAPNPWARAKFRNNVRVIHRYIELYGTKSWNILSRPRISLVSHGVRVSEWPDIAAEESGKVSLIKLGPAKQKESVEAIRIILRVIFSAATVRFKLEPRDITYLDIRRAVQYTGSPGDSDLDHTINSGCRSLVAMF